MLGGLIAIGIFIMNWTIDESLDKFELLARKTFQSSQSNFSKIQQLMTSYLRDSRYSSIAIEESFEESFQSIFDNEKGVNLFNPLTSDTKIAITTTIAKESATYIFSNYNSGLRPKELGSNKLITYWSRTS